MSEENNDYEHNEWSDADTSFEYNPYLGKPLLELVNAEQNFLAALERLGSEQTQKAIALQHALKLVQLAITPRQN